MSPKTKTKSVAAYDLGKLLHDVIGEMHEGVRVVGRDWRYLYVNTAAARQCMVDRKKMLGKPITDCHQGIEKTVLFSKLKQSMAQKKSFRLEHEYVLPDKSTRTFECYLHPVSEGVLILSFDVTKQKIAQRELAESEAKFRALVEKSLVGVYLIQDGVFKYANPKLGKIFGYKAGDLVKGMGPRDLVYPSDWPLVQENLKRRITGEIDTVHYRFNGIRSDKKVIRIEALGSRTIYNGRPAVIGSLFDVTDEERKDFEIKQRADELIKFKQAVEGSSDEIVFTDLDGRIVYANPALLKLTGYSMDEVMGKKPWDLWLKSDQPMDYEKLLQKLLVDKKPLSGEYVNHKKNKGVYISRTTTSPIMDKQGNVIYFVSVGVDVTREREIDRMKIEFVSVASHQMRTPLTGVKWLADLLLTEGADELSVKHRKMVQEIFQMNERMIRLVNDLLDVSFIETGHRFAVKRVPGDLAAAVRDAVSDSAIMANDKRIHVVMSRTMPKSLKCNFDEPKIRQVLLSLMNNAIDYSPPNSRVTIGCRRVHSEVVCSVADQGVGIPKKQQPRIFEKFFRADNVLPLKPGGTGLGLFIAKAIVDSHGGRIWFESKAGKGTTFFFSLPV
ncbi:PAS domain S-box protein [Candidatus Uhrbacteria bacterium]|nr:PAS domain S-box protein [Candidatus Uhrbacteria bacterium]